MSQKTLEQILNDLTNLNKGLDGNYILEESISDLQAYISAEDEKKAAKGWVKGTGELKIRKDNPITVEVYRNEKYPGVMIHRVYGYNSDLLPGYTLSHEKSGLIIGGKWSNMRKAVKAFLDHAAKVNWDRPTEEILKDPEAVEAAKKLNT